MVLGGALGPGFGVAGVAQPDIHLRFTWQVWHNLTSTVVLRGRRGTYGTGWRPAPAPNPGPRAPPSTISAMPATQNDGRCEIVPRLPRETTVDVRLCHACHAKWRGAPAPNPGPRAPPSTISATPATQNDGRCEIVPRLPREMKVDVRLCHACHAKWRGAPAPNPGPRAPPSTISATPATQNDGRCEIVPRLPRETKVDVRLCHACHAKWRGAPAPNPGPRAPPSTISATPATQNDGRCEIVPHLPRETKVDVMLCHACHAKWRGWAGIWRRGAAPLCVAGVAQPDIHLRFTWQAWHDLTSTVVLRGRRGTYGTGWRPWAGIWRRGAAPLCVAGVAQHDIHLRFTWQVWHNLTSTVVLRGRRGTYGTGWRPWAGIWRRGAAPLCVAGVAQPDIHLPVSSLDGGQARVSRPDNESSSL